jgi:GTP-binding protein Era
VAEPRSGFVAVAGRPNVGKSTLVNALTGAKVAIVSDKPQTTRRAIRGIATGARGGGPYQAVFVDLPGVQHPRDPLTERMQRRVERALGECDLALLVLSAAERSGAGDRFLARALGEARVPVVVAINKVDAAGKRTVADALLAAERLGRAHGMDLRELFPVSALRGSGVDALREAIAGLLPGGRLLYPGAERTDQPREVLIAELIREQAIRRTREEVPHSIEVQVQEVERRGERTVVEALVWVESPSQKGILIGSGGAMIKAVGSAARRELERELGGPVHLDLTVRVRRHWRRDEGLLDRLGIEG